MFSLNKGLLMHLFENTDKYTAYYITYVSFIVIVIVSSYLLGSINPAIMTSKILYHDDIRNHGSGNAGLTNMLRTFGKKAALFTLIGDMLKTALAIFIAGFLFGFNYIGFISDHDGYCYIAGLFVVLGHVFPVYYKFKGGKGVLAAATMALILSPIPFLILLIIFVGIVALTKYVSLGSVCAVIMYPVVINGYFNLVLKAQIHGFISATTIILAILIVWCHRGNLQRISNRTERKLSIGSRGKKDSDEK